MNKIDAKHVNFFYGDFQALKDISMTIEEKEVVAFSAAKIYVFLFG